MTTARKLFRLLSPSKTARIYHTSGSHADRDGDGNPRDQLGIPRADVDDRDRSGGSLPRPVTPGWIDSAIPARGKLAIFGMLMLVTVFAVKTLFLAILAWRQAAFVWGLQSDLSQRLFSGYLHQPYTFHMQRNSAQLIRNTMGHVAEFATLLQQSLVLVTEVLVVLGISALLVSVEPRGCIGGDGYSSGSSAGHFIISLAGASSDGVKHTSITKVYAYSTSNRAWAASRK